ncbi:unnamed protein product [Closterium sp. NIES-53]
MVQQVLQRFDFTYSSPQATPLSTRHSLSALPSDESVEPSGPYLELVGCLMYLMTYTRPDLAYPLSILARYVAPGRHRPEHMAAAKRVLRYFCRQSSQGYTFSLGSGSVSWRSTRSSSVLSSSCEAEIYAGAMAAQELHWLTYLLTDLGEQPRSPPVLYVDNKAMLALCREHRLEHRTKHITLRYFLARELQQRGQLRLAYVASEANTADIFTKALPPCDHQRFCTMLDRISVTPLLVGHPDILTWKEAIESQLEMAGLMGFAASTVAKLSESFLDLRAEFCVVQLLTFTVISRCCSPGVRIALKPCRDYLDAGHQAWHFIESTCQVTNDLYIGELEEQMTHLRMGGQETATDYCNRARRILATMRMAGVQYSTA